MSKVVNVHPLHHTNGDGEGGWWLEPPLPNPYSQWACYDSVMLLRWMTTCLCQVLAGSMLADVKV